MNTHKNSLYIVDNSLTCSPDLWNTGSHKDTKTCDRHAKNTTWIMASSSDQEFAFSKEKFCLSLDCKCADKMSYWSQWNAQPKTHNEIQPWKWNERK